MLQADKVLGALGLYVFAEEVGESGTPHLQGAVRFKIKTRFTAVKKLFKEQIHWEKCKGSWKQNVAYCTKVRDWAKLHGNIPEASRYKPREKRVMDAIYKDVVWRGWQKEVIDIVRGEVHPRKIYWFWEPEGNSGKSFLTKWLFMNYRCIVGGGKKADVFHQVAMAFEKDEAADPQLILLDIPRSAQKYCCYGAIEDLKNGFVNSGKYEGGVFCFNYPHVIVFANEEPDYNEMSADRWCVKRLRKKRTVGEALVRPGESRNYIP